MVNETTSRTDHGEGIVRLTLDRPEKHNAQSPELLTELDERLHELESDSETRVVIIDGNGPSFSTGHDLTPEMLEERANEWTIEDFLAFEEAYYYELSLAVRDLSIPTIAQVHGYCGAAGLMLAAMCDLIVAADDATFENPVHRMAATGVEVFIEPWEVGIRKAKELLWTGDSISGREAESLGLVNRAVPEEDLYDETMVLATKVARMPPFALKLSKKSFRFTSDQMGQQASFDYHMLLHQMQHVSREYSEWRKEAEDALEKGGLRAWLRHRDRPFQIRSTTEEGTDAE